MEEAEKERRFAGAAAVQISEADPRAEARSLVFLDAHLGPDNMDFLSKKYGDNPEVQAAMRGMPSKTDDYQLGVHDLFIQTCSGDDQEVKCINYIRSLLISSVHSPMLFARFCAKRVFGEVQIPVDVFWALIQKEIIPIMKETEATFISKLREQRTRQGNPLTDIEEVIFSLKTSPKHQVFHDITYGAYMIDAIRAQNGRAPLLFLGRAGCFFQLACEEFSKFRNAGVAAKDIYHLNFSGTPDIESKRTRGDLSDNSPEVIARHLLTPERLSFYCEYMDQQGMRNIENKLYLVDIIGTGRSLNSTLRVLRYYYERHLKREMPDVHFIALCADLLMDSIEESSVNFQDRKTAHWEYNSSMGTILFKETAEVGGIRPLQVKVSPLLMRSITGDIIDSDFVEAVGVHGIEYPPHKWRREFDVERARGGKLHEKLYGGLRLPMHEIFKVVDKKLLKENKESKKVA
ncbi:MAG: hypothetical protein B7Y25_04450 [Alphaproteobacteria bacterium 16-39-46]|nr:MAG: hypothetical protein B7Y25_04450 [Alphaproteobacteria bacterium 16-39-46]OZA42983.1 MAG: hypothetical protein B7X84_04370 [Alphaproteobacteria bacterium 17-39-52]